MCYRPLMASKFLFLIIMLAFTVACGSSDDGGGGSGPEPTVKIAGSVEIPGDLTASGDFARNAFTFQPSCAALAAEGHGPVCSAIGLLNRSRGCRWLYQRIPVLPYMQTQQ